MNVGERAIEWNLAGERLFETGLDRGVLYVKGAKGYGDGVAWNGLTAFSESPSGAEPTPLYADNVKYLNLLSTEEFSGTLEAYMYPDAFEECDGSKSLAPGLQLAQQTRTGFGFAYRTLVGNDIESTDYGYKLHLVYDCLAAPTEKSRTTVNADPEVNPFSWAITTTPQENKHGKPSAKITIDSTLVDKELMAKVEEILYGKKEVVGENAEVTTQAVPGRLPSIDELATLFKQ